MFSMLDFRHSNQVSSSCFHYTEDTQVVITDVAYRYLTFNTATECPCEIMTSWNV